MLEQENNNQQSSKYSLQVECASALNFVLQQNSVPLIKQILISSPNAIIDSKIVFKSKYNLIQSFEKKIPLLKFTFIC